MAVRFRFRLEPLLRLRSALEREAERALARAVQERLGVEALLQELQQQRAAVLEGRRREAGQTVDLSFLRAGERFLVALERRELQAREALLQAQQKVDARRLELARAHRDRLSLERLRERRKAQHDQEQARMEAVQNDELAMLRHSSRSA